MTRGGGLRLDGPHRNVSIKREGAAIVNTGGVHIYALHACLCMLRLNLLFFVKSACEVCV